MVRESGHEKVFLRYGTDALTERAWEDAIQGLDYIFVTLQQVSLKLGIFTILGSLFRRCRRIFTN